MCICPFSICDAFEKCSSRHEAASLLALELVLCDGEGIVKELFLFLLVRGLETSGDGSRRVTASVHDVLAVVELGLVEQSLDAGLGEAPGTGVQRLLLGPDNGLGVLVGVEVLLEQLPGEWVELLDTGNSNVVDVVVGTVLLQGSVDLTSAKNDTVNLLSRLDGASLMLRVRNDPLELRIRSGEIFNAGARKRVAQQGLGEEDDESYQVKSVMRKIFNHG